MASRQKNHLASQKKIAAAWGSNCAEHVLFSVINTCADCPGVVNSCTGVVNTCSVLIHLIAQKW